MSNKPKRQRLQSLHLINVCVTVLTLIAVGVLALVLPKPTVSEVERRELAKKRSSPWKAGFPGSLPSSTTPITQTPFRSGRSW